MEGLDCSAWGEGMNGMELSRDVYHGVWIDWATVSFGLVTLPPGGVLLLLSFSLPYLHHSFIIFDVCLVRFMLCNLRTY